MQQGSHAASGSAVIDRISDLSMDCAQIPPAGQHYDPLPAGIAQSQGESGITGKWNDRASCAMVGTTNGYLLLECGNEDVEREAPAQRASETKEDCGSLSV